eukprot:COSAG05_NODE_33_length_28089_cov_31.909289_16_plen_59_part_00
MSTGTRKATRSDVRCNMWQPPLVHGQTEPIQKPVEHRHQSVELVGVLASSMRSVVWCS